MYLKKKFIQVPFLNKKSFSITYFDEKDLKNGVIKLCNHLKKGTLLIQVFLRDELNDVLSLYSNFSFQYRNFNYYLIDSLNFLHILSFERIKFLNVYSFNKNINIINLKLLNEIKENYTFQLWFDNYLECVEIVINCSYYDEKMFNNLEIE